MATDLGRCPARATLAPPDSMGEIEMIMRLLANLAQRAIVFCVLCLIVWHVTHIGSASHGKAIVFRPSTGSRPDYRQSRSTRTNPSRSC